MTNRALKTFAAATGLLVLAALTTSLAAPGAGAQGIGLPAILAEIHKLRAEMAPRRYYLTSELVPAGVATTACAADFHMASFWEIHDTTNLKYDSTLGLVLDDSGEGPPSDEVGWIRTGNTSRRDIGVGEGNCNTWSSSEKSDFGTAVQLPGQWDADAARSTPWVAFNPQCDFRIRVWCVESR